MSLVVDASVAVKWVVLEESRADALRRTAGVDLAGPDFVLVEAANILWKKVRRKELDQKQAHLGLEFIRGAYQSLVPASDLIDDAASISFEIDHPVYDCLYLACARRLGLSLLTADQKLAQRGEAAGFEVALLSRAAP